MQKITTNITAIKTLTYGVIATLLLGLSTLANATTVQFETALGNFEVNLYDQNTPATVANFLQYVENGDYQNTVIHRSIPGFIIQGGGYKYDTEWPLVSIPAQNPVVNEPIYSNVRGTIAMAKLSGNPDSATNQWFINLVNNSTDLDQQNEGFTVFGQVTGDGMNIVDNIAALQRFNFSGVLTDLPLQNYSDTSTNPDVTQLILITNITVIDASPDTAAGLNPPLNTAPDPQPETPSSSGGGSFHGIILIALGILVFSSRRKVKTLFK